MEETKNEQPVLLEEVKEPPKDKKSSQGKKIKNLISAVILLIGLFLGSLFVDAVQMVRGKGFSQRALDKTDVFSLDGKSWVAYADPIVKVKVISDDSCETCSPDQALVWFRRVIPTMLPEKVDANSEEGKTVAEKYSVKSIPAFVFDKEVKNTDFYSQAAALFSEINEGLVLQTAQLGLEAGKYIQTPSVGENDIVIGSPDAKVKIVEFSDFQCPYCKAFQLNTIQKILADYKDKIFFVYKNLPLDFHSQSENAALAAECAYEQNRFETYSRKLFENQDDWGKSAGTPASSAGGQKFKNYAVQLGADAEQFNKCLDDKKYQDKINEDKKEAEEFGISGTPAIFINDQFKAGVVSYEDMKKIIEEELAK